MQKPDQKEWWLYNANDTIRMSVIAYEDDPLMDTNTKIEEALAHVILHLYAWIFLFAQSHLNEKSTDYVFLSFIYLLSKWKP